MPGTPDTTPTAAPAPIDNIPVNALFALLYTLIALGAYFQVDYIVQFNPIDHIFSDTQRHWNQGTDSLRNDPMSMTDPLLYQLYIGVLAKLTLQNPALVAFYTSLLALFTPWFWYRFFRELQPSKLIATAGWAALSILPSWMAIYGFFMQETLLLPLLGLALHATWRCKRRGDLGSFVVMVFIWALAGLTRGIAIPLAAVACIWLWQVQNDKLKKAAYSLLVLGLILGPLTYRSYTTMNMIAPHGIGQLVALYSHSGKKVINISFQRGDQKWAYWYGSPSTGEMPFAPLSDWKSARSDSVIAHINIDNGTQDWDKVLEANSLTLNKYLWLTKENMIFLFFGSSWPDKNLSRTVDRLSHHGRWLWAPLTLMVGLWSVLWWRRLKGSQMLSAILLMWILVQGLVPIAVNEGRYRKPFEGLLIAQLVLLASSRRYAPDSAHAQANSDASTAARPNPALVAPLTLAGLATCGLTLYGLDYLRTTAHFDDTGRVYLSDMTPVSHQQSWGNMQLDQNLEGAPLRIHGHSYRKGLAVHANAITRYRIPSQAKYFHTFYGLDDKGKNGAVEFRILLDDKEVFRSGRTTHTAAKEVFLPLQNVNELTLIVDALATQDHDHADWAQASFLREYVEVKASTDIPPNEP